MDLFGEIVRSVFLTEGIATVSNVNDAINNLKAVEIRYTPVDKENKALGRRIIYPVAYGLTKAGNPVIRAFEPYGDTHTKVPAWKFFLLDGIRQWRPLKNKTFKGEKLEGFNPDGDLSMSVVYNIANIEGKPKDFKPQEVKVDAVSKADIDPTAKEKEVAINADDTKKYTSKEIINNMLQGIDKPNEYISKDEADKMLSGIKQQINSPKQKVSPEVMAQIERDNARKKLAQTKKRGITLDNENELLDIINKQPANKMIAPQTQAFTKNDFQQNQKTNVNRQVIQAPSSPIYRDDLDKNNNK